MRHQAQIVLDYLGRAHADTDTNIGRSLDMPATSVRRLIQELIHSGVNITYAGPTTGLYTLVRVNVGTLKNAVHAETKGLL